jgi:hypothetical protein
MPTLSEVIEAMPLHQSLDTLEALETSLDCAETPEERAEIEAAIAKTLDRVGNRVDAYAGLIRREEHRIAEGRELIDNASHRLKVRQARVDRIRARALFEMQQREIKKLEGLTAVLTRSPGRESLVIEDASAVPVAYCTVTPPQLVPDKAAIKRAIKSGAEVPGVRVVTGSEILVVR